MPIAKWPRQPTVPQPTMAPCRPAPWRAGASCARVSAVMHAEINRGHGNRPIPSVPLHTSHEHTHPHMPRRSTVAWHAGARTTAGRIPTPHCDSERSD